jgi:tRNA-dihydrouridine synthase B
MLKIAALELSSPCMLAPMSGITDLPFRMITRSLGCEFAFSEMISARSLVFQSRTSERLLRTNPGDRPLGLQLLGNDARTILKALESISGHSFDLIDVNAACPVNKVVRKGEGAAMLREPHKLAEMLKHLVKNYHLPVTVKIRSGWDDDSINAAEVALLAEDAGVSALFIHGRTAAQGYRGKADHRIIRKVKSLMRIPVVASGDAFSPELIKRMLDETGCDGVAIARGALGNPWIFRETAQFLASGTIVPKPETEEIIATMIDHLSLACDHRGDKAGAVFFRKFFGWYARGIPGTKGVREKAFGAETKGEMLVLINSLRGQRTADYSSPQ